MSYVVPYVTLWDIAKSERFSPEDRNRAALYRLYQRARGRSFTIFLQPPHLLLGVAGFPRVPVEWGNRGDGWVVYGLELHEAAACARSNGIATWCYLLDEPLASAFDYVPFAHHALKVWYRGDFSIHEFPNEGSSSSMYFLFDPDGVSTAITGAMSRGEGKTRARVYFRYVPRNVFEGIVLWFWRKLV